MKFKQDKESNITFVGFDVKKHDFPDPEVGKTYKAFDDGKIRRSRLMFWKITKAINLDSDKISKNVLKMIGEEIYNCHWLYAPEQTIIYRAKAVDEKGNYDKNVGYCYFLKTKAGEWFGACCGWWGGVLDTDNYYYNMMLEQEAEDEREHCFKEEAIDVIAKSFPQIKEVDWYGNYLEKMSDEDYESVKKLLENYYQVKPTNKQYKSLEKYRWEIIGVFYHILNKQCD